MVSKKVLTFTSSEKHTTTITIKIQPIMANAIDINTIKIGTKIISNNMIMVVTGKTKTDFVGYIERNGEKISGDDVRIQFSTFTNPHYQSGIRIEQN